MTDADASRVRGSEVVISAALFDTDGVVTDTAAAHAAAWKRLFDGFLEARAERLGVPFEAFDPRLDYLRHVDGKPRNDGVASFLAARDIELPYGDADDKPEVETVCGLARRKDGYFQQWLEENRVQAYPGTVRLIRALRTAGVKVGVFSASRNAAAVLENAGVLDLFDARCDGTDAAELALPGKPDPAMLFELARRLAVDPASSLVIEDAIAGVRAGAEGDFAMVVGVARAEEQADALAEAGADLVVNDLSELRLAGVRGYGPGDGQVTLELKTLATLADIDDAPELLREQLGDQKVASFLDYDGTLTPIVRDHTHALLDDTMRRAVDNLSRHALVTIVSGRDLTRLKQLVKLDGVIYAGSHGFEIDGPPGSNMSFELGTECLPELDRLETTLDEALSDIEGHALERKRFSLAVHYRNVAQTDVPRLQSLVEDALGERSGLRLGHGKKVFEIRPDMTWGKGHAVLRVLELMFHEPPLVIYIGDDLTDEDAFQMLAGRALCIAVRHDEDRQTAADYAVADTEAVRRLLESITRLVMLDSHQ